MALTYLSLRNSYLPSINGNTTISNNVQCSTVITSTFSNTSTCNISSIISNNIIHSIVNISTLSTTYANIVGDMSISGNVSISGYNNLSNNITSSITSLLSTITQLEATILRKTTATTMQGLNYRGEVLGYYLGDGYIPKADGVGPNYGNQFYFSQ